jgi:hypothetical protein
METSLDIVRVIRVVRVLRLISMNTQMRSLLGTLEDVHHVILRFFFVFFLIIYSFSCISVEIFKENIAEDFDPNDDDFLDTIDSRVQLNNLKEALLAMFQIAITNNWQDIMFYQVYGSKIGMFGSIFFVLYFVIVVWFGTNIMTAMILGAHVTMVERRQEEKKILDKINHEKRVRKANAKKTRILKARAKADNANASANTANDSNANSRSRPAERESSNKGQEGPLDSDNMVVVKDVRKRLLTKKANSVKNLHSIPDFR